MQKISSTLIDDLDGTESAQTVQFALDGKAYKIDLSKANAGRLRGDLSAYIANATLDKGAAKATRTTQPKASTENREENARIRQWAQQNGYVLADRGRLPKQVIDDYKAAQAKPAEPAFSGS